MFDFDFEKWEEENPYPVIEDSDGISKTLSEEEFERISSAADAADEAFDKWLNSIS